MIKKNHICPINHNAIAMVALQAPVGTVLNNIYTEIRGVPLLTE